MPADHVCDRELLCELMDVRSSFEATPRSRYSAARRASNAYECLGEPACNPFLNRSALKLANMDHLMPLGTDTPLTFVDLCGGPGGFSEYLLSRPGLDAGAEVHGWGMTLEGCDCPWDWTRLARWLREEEHESKEKASPNAPNKRQKTTPSPKRTLRLCYGHDGTGDLCRPENVQHLAQAVGAPRVGIVVADGGFAGARARFDQEGTMLPLLVSEAAAMVRVLRPGGCFVCKFFDITSPGTVEVVALLALLFERVAMSKPVTSRPASSERYFLGQGFVGGGVGVDAEALLHAMLERAQAGYSDGLTLQGAKTVNGGDLAASVRRLVATPGSSFIAWLRAVNDKLMQCQLQACYAILERLEGEESRDDGEAGQEAVNIEQYRRAWGLDKIEMQ